MSLLCLRNINISFNEQFSVLVVACLCSYYSRDSCKGNKARGKRSTISNNDIPATWKWTNYFRHWFSGRRIFFWCGEHFVRFWSFWRFLEKSNADKTFVQIKQGSIKLHITFVIVFFSPKENVNVTRSLVSEFCANTLANDVTCKWRFCHSR